MPADALKSSARRVQQRLSSSPGTGRVFQRPESSVYSEVSDQPLTPPTGRREGHSKDASTPPLTMRTAEVIDDPYEEVEYRGELRLRQAHYRPVKSLSLGVGTIHLGPT